MTNYVLIAAAVFSLTACGGGNYTADTYAASAVQQANKVEQGTVVGFRQVKISANGTVGAVTGGAAGGVLGSQSGSFGINSALGTVGGTMLGSIIGTTIEHVAGDTKGWEYIIRKKDNELLSVTQQDEKAIPVGQKVLVITGSQARVLPDYSQPHEAPAAGSSAPAHTKPTAVDTPEAPKEPAKEPAKEPTPLGPAPSAAEPAPAPVAAPPAPAPIPATPPAPASTPAPAAAEPKGPELKAT